jgi:aspartyl-tRNA(Asn)/glutamyl-tRNA(Gln) amidotransferase subunit A
MDPQLWTFRMPNTLSIAEAARRIQSGDLSPVELVNACLNRIDTLDDRLCAWVTIDRDDVLKVAQQRQEECTRGKIRGPLHGIPIGIKDIFYTKNLRTSGGSAFLEDFVPDFDATAVLRLQEAGAIILGKTATTEYASFDPADTCNPWDFAHTPGGSSSGSAAGVAAHMCLAALGSQTGGSITRPAAYCGIVGFKPTYSRVSMHGVLPVSFSLDHVGPLTRTVKDAAIVFQAIGGADPSDPLCTDRDMPDCVGAIDIDLKTPPRIGIIPPFFMEKADNALRRATELAIETFRAGGAKVIDIVAPKSFKGIINKHRLIMYAEAAAYHAERFEQAAEKFRPNLRGLIQEGLLLPAVAYADALEHRLQFRSDLRHLFKKVDILLTPATPTQAPEGLSSTGNPAFNAPWSHAGLPTITLPVTVTDGLPCGIQLIGPAWREDHLLQTAQWCETHLGFDTTPDL